jgi:hypothetical protein
VERWQHNVAPRPSLRQKSRIVLHPPIVHSIQVDLVVASCPIEALPIRSRLGLAAGKRWTLDAWTRHNFALFRFRMNLCQKERRFAVAVIQGREGAAWLANEERLVVVRGLRGGRKARRLSLSSWALFSLSLAESYTLFLSQRATPPPFGKPSGAPLIDAYARMDRARLRRRACCREHRLPPPNVPSLRPTVQFHGECVGSDRIGSWRSV